MKRWNIYQNKCRSNTQDVKMLRNFVQIYLKGIEMRSILWRIVNRKWPYVIAFVSMYMILTTTNNIRAPEFNQSELRVMRAPNLLLLLLLFNAMPNYLHMEWNSFNIIVCNVNKSLALCSCHQCTALVTRRRHLVYIFVWQFTRHFGIRVNFISIALHFIMGEKWAAIYWYWRICDLIFIFFFNFPLTL